MRQNSSRHVILSESATFDEETGDLRIVIETPKGSRNKYKYAPACDCLELATALPEAMVFPYDFEFVLETPGQDGDPLDVLVLMDAPVVPGCVIGAVCSARSRPDSPGRKIRTGSGTTGWSRLPATPTPIRTLRHLRTCARTCRRRSWRSLSSTTNSGDVNSDARRLRPAQSDEDRRTRNNNVQELTPQGRQECERTQGRIKMTEAIVRFVVGGLAVSAFSVLGESVQKLRWLVRCGAVHCTCHARDCNRQHGAEYATSEGLDDARSSRHFGSIARVPAG